MRAAMRMAGFQVKIQHLTLATKFCTCKACGGIPGVLGVDWNEADEIAPELYEALYKIWQKCRPYRKVGQGKYTVEEAAKFVQNLIKSGISMKITEPDGMGRQQHISALVSEALEGERRGAMEVARRERKRQREAAVQQFRAGSQVAAASPSSNVASARGGGGPARSSMEVDESAEIHAASLAGPLGQQIARHQAESRQGVDPAEEGEWGDWGEEPEETNEWSTGLRDPQRQLAKDRAVEAPAKKLDLAKGNLRDVAKKSEIMIPKLTCS